MAKVFIDRLGAAGVQRVALCHEVGYHQVDQAVAGEATCVYLVQASFLQRLKTLPLVAIPLKLWSFRGAPESRHNRLIEAKINSRLPYCLRSLNLIL